MEKNENCLSLKRRREQLMEESYQAFGFSFDSVLELKKGYSKLEKEKMKEKEKREQEKLNCNKTDTKNIKEIPQNIELNEQRDINNSDLTLNMELKKPVSFMEDAIKKKSRIEIDKENFLETQKKLNKTKEIFIKNQTQTQVVMENEVNTMSYSQRKKALLKNSCSGTSIKFKFFAS